MRATPEIITSAMQLYFIGESLRSVQKFIKLQGIDFSHVAIYEWIKKYTKLMDGYLSTIKPQVEINGTQMRRGLKSTVTENTCLQ